MFIPTFQGLTATDFVLSASGRETRRRHPFDVPHLTFYRARNAIYHLFKVLKPADAPLTVLVPDYNSGNEVLALEAAGATIRYYPVGADGEADVAEVERLCARHHADVLYVIHYLGWPQPIRQLADLARRRGIWLVEDCALALLSDAGDQPLGTFGHFSVFCLYKTLPLPNGACLVENGEHLADLEHVQLRQAGLPSVLGRTADLVVRNLRSRSDSLGAAMESMKRAAGRAAGAMDVPRAKIGDIGFNLNDVDLAMSDISTRLLRRIDFDEVRDRRIENYRRLASAVDGLVTPLHESLPAGACPLFFPILVPDKTETADILRSCGVDVLEFWNHGAEVVDGRREVEPGSDDSFSAARYLRRHVLGLPIHQDLTFRHIDYVAEQIKRLGVRKMS
jgi:perosamine synthetase